MITTRATTVHHPEGDLRIRLVERPPAGRPSSFAIIIETDRATAIAPRSDVDLTRALAVFDAVVAHARLRCAQPPEETP
jgi:hypothetical protein